MKKAPEGAVNPNPVPFAEPKEMTRRIKGSLDFSAPTWSGSPTSTRLMFIRTAPKQSRRWRKSWRSRQRADRYAICLGFSSDYYKFLSNNSRISDAEYGLGNQRMIPTTFMLAGYIREMGYPAQSHDYSKGVVNPIPLAVNAGLGELGRHGMLDPCRIRFPTASIRGYDGPAARGRPTR